VSTNTFSNAKINYVTNVDLDELYNLSIQKFFIWGYLVSYLTNFVQNHSKDADNWAAPTVVNYKGGRWSNRPYCDPPL